MLPEKFTRKFFLKSGLFAGASAFLGSIFASQSSGEYKQSLEEGTSEINHKMPRGAMRTVGNVDHERNGFDPYKILTDWDTGKTSTLPNGQTLREYEFVAIDKEIEIAPGIFFPAWTYNGRVPGPTIRCTEGDRVRVHFINAGSHPHTIHFHGIHDRTMDGVPDAGPGMIEPSESFTYEFDALPFGCHLYHCHSTPLKRHIHKGLYGAFIIDPDPAKHTEHQQVAESRLLGSPENEKWHEFMIIMHGFNNNFHGENAIYAANTIAFAYDEQPIKIERGKPVRVYLINTTEFDPINSFHLHANFFDFYDHGTTFEPTQKTVDTIMMWQAQRGILEFSYSGRRHGFFPCGGCRLVKSPSGEDVRAPRSRCALSVSAASRAK